MSTQASGPLATIARVPANLSRHDLTTGGTIMMSAVTLGIVVSIDLLDNSIGAVFTVGFLLVVVTAPLAVTDRGLYVIALMPPVLMLLSMLAIASLNPEALVVENLPDTTGPIGHAISAMMQNGGVLMLGQALTIVAALLRRWNRQEKRIVFYSQS
jgi:hypothetical protein